MHLAEQDDALVRQVADRHASALRQRVARLRSLEIPSAADVIDTGLKHLAGRDRLVELDVSNLRGIQLAHTAVTDAGLEHLRGLPKLQSLNVRDTKVSPEALKRLRHTAP